jgi:hypothetical protein
VVDCFSAGTGKRSDPDWRPSWRPEQHRQDPAPPDKNHIKKTLEAAEFLYIFFREDLVFSDFSAYAP